VNDRPISYPYSDWVSAFSSSLVEPWRSIVIYSATIAFSDPPAMSAALALARRAGVKRETLYEIVLQSYLFLGFPRMLGAAEIRAEDWPREDGSNSRRPDLQIESWWRRGEQNFRLVYGDHAQRLKDRVESFAPEIFDWMIIEGYGKVLSRPQLDMPLRELSVIAFLMVDNRPRQLMSHLRGALRVGAPMVQIVQAVEDLRAVAPHAHEEAKKMLVRCGVA
jgi:alkylhydroperoxidase/carboxymuconolactone decarboxylase family protein YurZ